MTVEVAQNKTKEAAKSRIVANVSIGNHDNSYIAKHRHSDSLPDCFLG